MSLRREQAATLRVRYWDYEYYGKAARRASTMDTDAIYGWIETAVSGMYKAMSDFRRDGQLESLIEMQEGLTASYALLAELRDRREAKDKKP